MKKTIYLIILLMFSSVASAGLIDGSKIEATLLSQTPDPVKPGEFVELRWKVENLGEALNNIEFELIPEYPFSLLSSDDGKRKIGNLYGRQQGDDAAILYYKLKVDERAVEGNNKIKLKYSSKKQTVTFSDFTVRVQTDDSILSIDEVTSSPSLLSPGEKAKINIKLKNQADSTLKDIKLKWDTLSLTSSTTELPFTPLGSTNEKVINKLLPKSEEVVSFYVFISPDAESKDYKIELKLEYQDEIGKNFSKTNIMGLVVGHTPDLRIILEETNLVKPNSNGEISVKIVNKGVSDVKFVNLVLEESECHKIISPNEVYLGNIDSDDYESAEFQVHVNSCNNFPLTLTYNDANNKEYTEEHTLSLRVFSKDEAVKYGLIKKSNKFGIFLVILIVVGGFYLWRRYKK